MEEFQLNSNDKAFCVVVACVLTALVMVLSMSVFARYLDAQHREKMAEKGYVQKVEGLDIIWVKQ